jgi:predicted PurR-regulated permease PerM
MSLTDREHVTAVIFYVALAAFVYLVCLMVWPFLVPLGWAAVLVIVFHPVHARFEQRYGPARAAALSTLAVAVIVVAPLIIVTTAFVREAIQSAADVQRAFEEGRLAWFERAWEWVQRRSGSEQRFDIASTVVDLARRIASFLAAQAGNLVQNVFVFFFDLVIVLFAAFFLFRDGDGLMHAIRRTLPVDRPLRERFIRQTRELVEATVQSAGIVAGVQGLLGGVLFAALGIKAPVFWGVVMFFFCLLPFGAWVVWLPAAILFFASGDWKRGVILAAFGFGVVSMVDNVLRPWLLSGRARMNGLLVLISLLGGVSVFGSLGLVLGPTLMATAIGILRTYTNADPIETPPLASTAGDSPQRATSNQ